MGDAIYLPQNSSTITHKKVKSSLTEEADNWMGWRVMAHTGDEKLRCGIVSHWSKTNLTCSIMFKDDDGQWTEEQEKVPTSNIKEKAIYKGGETLQPGWEERKATAEEFRSQEGTQGIIDDDIAGYQQIVFYKHKAGRVQLEKPINDDTNQFETANIPAESSKHSIHNITRNGWWAGLSGYVCGTTFKSRFKQDESKTKVIYLKSEERTNVMKLRKMTRFNALGYTLYMCLGLDMSLISINGKVNAMNMNANTNTGSGLVMGLEIADMFTDLGSILSSLAFLEFLDW